MPQYSITGNSHASGMQLLLSIPITSDSAGRSELGEPLGGWRPLLELPRVATPLAFDNVWGTAPTPDFFTGLITSSFDPSASRRAFSHSFGKGPCFILSRPVGCPAVQDREVQKLPTPRVTRVFSPTNCTHWVCSDCFYPVCALKSAHHPSDIIQRRGSSCLRRICIEQSTSTDPLSAMERRTHNHWPVNGAASAFCLQGEQFGQTYDLRLLDFGHGGLGAKAQEPVDQGALMSFGFEHPGYTAQRGRVLGCQSAEDGYRLAVRFEEPVAA